MILHIITLVLLGIALLFTGLTLLSLAVPPLAPASRNPLRYGVIALVAYALMAISLSIGDIQRRGYDQRYESYSTLSTTSRHSTG